MALDVGNRAGLVAPLVERVVVDGKLLRSSTTGQEIFLRGISQGAWLQDAASDLAPIKALGANHVRKLLRWWGPYSDPAIDSRDSDPAHGLVDPPHFAKLEREVREAAAQGLYVFLACESDCGQYGAGSAENIAYCDPLGLYGASGHNFWTDLAMREAFKLVWQFVARRFLDVPNIAGFEILPEPRGDATSADAATIRAFYDEVRAAIRAVDKRTPLVVGPRSYEDTVLVESLMADYDDIIYTANLLNGRSNAEATIHTHVRNFDDFRSTYNVPVYANQVGLRTADDPNQTEQNGVLSMLNARKVHYSYWEFKQHGTSPDEYAWNISDGADGFINKPAPTASGAYHFTQTLEALEAAALAAAAAAGLSLWYVGANLANIFQDSAGTVPTTVVGQYIKRIEKMAGSGYFNQPGADTLAPKLTLLSSGRPGLLFDAAAGTFLRKNDAFFTGADDIFAMFVGECGSGAANRVALHGGNGANTVRYPYLAVNASDVAHASCRGDDNVLQSVDGTIVSSARPIVITFIKSGASKKAWVNGFAEGAENTAAVGSIASMTRIQWGATTSGTNGWNGTSALCCLGHAAPTAEQYRAIERFGCFLAAGAYRGPIPT